MSARTEHGGRGGAALLLAIVIVAITSVAVLALWRAVAGLDRARILEQASSSAASLADSALVRGVGLLDSAPWLAVPEPGDSATLVRGVTARGGRWRVSIGRAGWTSLVLRSVATLPSGAPGVSAVSDRRLLVPLLQPIPMPTAALTGAVAWAIDPAALVDIPAPLGRESLCRPAGSLRATDTAAFPAPLDVTRYRPVDPDTVSDSLVGAFRLTRGHLGRPLRVTGMVVLDSALVLDADLRLTGVLLTRGSVRPAAGHLMVTGAVVAGDAGGGHSGLGPGDWVRYDACAIRRAMTQVTSRGAASTWTHVTLF